MAESLYERARTNEAPGKPLGANATKLLRAIADDADVVTSLDAATVLRGSVSVGAAAIRQLRARGMVKRSRTRSTSSGMVLVITPTGEKYLD